MSGDLQGHPQRPEQRNLRRLQFRPLDGAEALDRETPPETLNTFTHAKPLSQFLPAISPEWELEQSETQLLPAYDQDGEVTQRLAAQHSPQLLPGDEPCEEIENSDTQLLPASKRYEEVETLLLPITQLLRLPSLSGSHSSQTDVPLPQPNGNGSTFQAAHTEDQLESSLGVDKRDTIPLMVVNGIAAREGKAQPALKSEVSGAAGAAGLVGIGNILGTVLKYVGNFLIQYSLGPGLYGLYTLCLSLVNLTSAIFSLGLDNAMIRYIAIYRGKRQIGSLRGLLLFCTIVVGIAGLIGAFLLLFFTPPLVAFWTHLRPSQAANNKNTLVQMIPLLQLMTPMIPLMGMQVVWFGGLRGFKAFKWRVIATSLVQPLVQIALLVTVIRLYRGVVGVAIVMLVSTMLTTVLYLYFLFREYARVATPEPQHYEFREWVVFSTLNFLTNIVTTILDSVDTLLLASFGLSKVAIGQYGAAIRLGPIITMPLLTLNVIFSPIIAELHSKGEWEKLEQMFKIVTKWAITFSLPLFLIASLFSPYILALSGAGYIQAWPLVIAFCLGNLIGAATGSSGSMLMMTGHNKLSFLNSVVAVIANVALGIWLTPKYGAMGTALSTGLAYCILNIMRLLQVWIVLKVQPYRLDTLKPIAAGLLSSALIGGILYFISKESHHIRTHITIGHAIISFQLGLIPVFLLVYAGLIVLFKGSPEDEIVLKAIRKKLRMGKKKRAAKA